MDGTEIKLALKHRNLGEKLSNPRHPYNVMKQLIRCIDVCNNKKIQNSLVSKKVFKLRFCLFAEIEAICN